MYETFRGAGDCKYMSRNANERTVIRFPAERRQCPGRGGATGLQIAKGRFKQWSGKILNCAHMPGAIQPMDFEDRLAGQHFSVSVGELFVCVTVNGRDYYFDRITGRFDGTGAIPS
jgi:hypothetical protein